MTVITTKDAASQAGISIVALNNHLRAGHLPSARQLSNGNWVVSQEMVEKFIADRAAGFVPKRGRRKRKPFETKLPGCTGFDLAVAVRKELKSQGQIPWIVDCMSDEQVLAEYNKRNQPE